MKLGLVDLGTNSVRYDAYAIEGGQPLRLHREKRMVRLGDGAFESGRLTETALARTAAALSDFAAINARLGIKNLVAVATAAVRSAGDAAALERLQHALGAPIQVLSGDDEAALIADGVLHSGEHLPSGAYLLVDIGGGSTELNLIQNGRRLEGVSLDLGANRLQQQFLRGVPPVKGGVAALRTHCREQLASFKTAHHWPDVKELVGSSGSIKAVRKLAKANDAKDQPFTLHFVTQLNERLQGLDRLSLQHIPGMDEHRVDLILAGSLLLQEILQTFEATKVRSSEASLREGLLLRELSALKARA